MHENPVCANDWTPRASIRMRLQVYFWDAKNLQIFADNEVKLGLQSDTGRSGQAIPTL